MEGWSALLRAWDLEPSIVAGCASLAVGYVAARRDVRALGGRFMLGIALLALALMSPLDALSDEYLFSAHMLQHLILVLIVPPLLVSGLPAEPLRRLLRVRWIGVLERRLSRLPVAWVVGIGTLAAWHVPVLYNAALANEDLHVVEHLCFLVSATIFWWPVFTPVLERRPRLTPTLLYVVTAGYANAIIGAVLFAAPLGIYPAYLHPEDTLHVLALLRGSWGLTPAEDQQMGALLMILGGSFPFAVATFWVLWSHRNERARQAPAAPSEV